MIRAGFAIEPRNLLIRSTVPEGSGSQLLGRARSLLRAGAAGRSRDWSRSIWPASAKGPNANFVGMPCGIMDQYISIFGREHAAICIDCRSLEHQVAPLPDGVTFLAVNTMVKHELASSAYKERTEQCAAAVEIIARQYPGTESLRDVTPEMFEQAEAALPPLIARRARHVVTEDARVAQFVRACA